MSGKVTHTYKVLKTVTGKLALRTVIGRSKCFIVVDAPNIKKSALNLVGDALGSSLLVEVCRRCFGDKAIDAAALFNRLKDFIRTNDLPDFLSDFRIGFCFRVMLSDGSYFFEARFSA